MKYKLILENLVTGTKQKHRALREIAEVFNVDNYQARGGFLSENKQYLHP